MSMNIIEILKSSTISIVFNNTDIESGVNEPWKVAKTCEKTLFFDYIFYH